jgi:maltose alpha-D-glucosyltransferase/alpha-amylase
MLRSFHYAVYTAWSGLSAGSRLRPEDQQRLEPAAEFWYQWVSVAFLNAYVANTAGAALFSSEPQELALLFDVYMLEKALYEIDYELNNRPAWVHIPLRGVHDLVSSIPKGDASP